MYSENPPMYAWTSPIVADTSGGILSLTEAARTQAIPFFRRRSLEGTTEDEARDDLGMTSENKCYCHDCMPQKKCSRIGCS